MNNTSPCGWDHPPARDRRIASGAHRLLGAADLSPITLGAAVHFDTWVPNFGIQEYLPHEAPTMEVFRHDHSFEDGYLRVSDAPGHGVDIDEEKAAEFGYEPAYLPINRLIDGTVWDW